MSKTNLAILDADASTPDVLGVFDTTHWEHASDVTCKREQILPNRLAYSETSGTLALIVKRSRTGNDFALSKAGLDYLLSASEKGRRKDGKPIRHTIIVLAEDHPHESPGKGRVITSLTAHEMRDQLGGLEPQSGKYSRPFWWVSPPDGF
jgi:hypothetical protein